MFSCLRWARRKKTIHALRSETPGLLSGLSALIQDRLLLLSPRTWFGLLRVLFDRPFAPLDVDSIVEAALGVVVSLLAIRIAVWKLVGEHCGGGLMLGERPGLGCAFTSRMLLASLASPWTLLAVWQGCVVAHSAVHSLRNYHVSRFQTLDSALDVRRRRLACGRALETRRFDVYLPEFLADASREVAEAGARLEGDVSILDCGNGSLGKTLDSETMHEDVDGFVEKIVRCTVRDHEGHQHHHDCSTDRPKRIPVQAVLIIPGALIPHQAYAEVAALLSDSGLVVVVISLEPTRLPTEHLGADSWSVRRIMAKVERVVEDMMVMRRSEADGSATISHLDRLQMEWSLLGHSMGCFAACRLFPKLIQRRSGRSPRIALRKIVLWGVGAFTGLATNLSAYDCRVLIVQGSEDAVVAMGRPWQSKFDRMFPALGTHRLVLGGGTHDGFASYSRRKNKHENFPNKLGNTRATEGVEGEASVVELSRAEQQRRACEVTAKFLLDDAD